MNTSWKRETAAGLLEKQITLNEALDKVLEPAFCSQETFEVVGWLWGKSLKV